MSDGERPGTGAAALRGDALACLGAGIRAVEPERLVRDLLAAEPPTLAAPAAVHVVGVGKAAAAMARGARQMLGEAIAGGVLILPKGDRELAPEGFRVFEGGHPVPNREGVEGGLAILELAAGLGADDLLLALISGGGSALMTLPPPEVALEELQELTAALLRAGATIGDLNCVRKHLDRLKGGRLARAAAPAGVLALLLSDVVGDPPDVIASGPVSPDPTTFGEAIGVLRRFGLWEEAAPALRRHLERGGRGEIGESPGPGDPCFDGVETRIVGSNRMAAEAALAEAGRRGYRTLLLTTLLSGEAREVGRVLASLGLEARRSGHPLAAPACLLAAGETTVTVRGSGRGGRNQELALGAAQALAGSAGLLVASLGTDGIDGPTDAAGALADGETVARASRLGLDAGAALADNDAYPLFEALDDLIVIGPTGTNVMDLALVLVAA